MKNAGIIALIVLICSCSTDKNAEITKGLPFYADANFNPIWFEDDAPSDFHKISSFELFDQSGKPFSEINMKDKIVVADFFFTSCTGICPKMTSNMSVLQDEFMDDDDIVLLSHSVTPEADSISVLNTYAEIHGIDEAKWHLLTGSRETIYALGRKSYFVEEDLGVNKDDDDFLHTENFVLIDKNRRIRGIYNGLNKADINQLIKDIATLKSS